MTLYISGKWPKVRQVELPMPLDELKRQIETVRAEGDSKVPSVHNADCPIPSMGWHLQYTKLDCDSVLRKLNQLAETIGKMDTAGLYHLNKSLSTEHSQSLDNILRAATHIKQEDLSSYEFIPDVTTDQALGKWLVEHHKFEIPDHLLPHLNYDSVGIEYRHNHDGAFLTNGYAGIQSGTMEQVLKNHSLLQLSLITPKKEYTLYLPASDDNLEYAKRALDLDDLSQAAVSSVEFKAPHLKDLIPTGLVTVEEAHALAQCLQDMELNDSELTKYCSVLAVENPTTFSEAVSIAMDIDDYEQVSEDMDEYGKQVLRRIGADDEIIDTIDVYMDFARLGEDSMEQDGVRRTEFGLVRRLSEPFPQQETGQTMC